MSRSKSKRALKFFLANKARKARQYRELVRKYGGTKERQHAVEYGLYDVEANKAVLALRELTETNPELRYFLRQYLEEAQNYRLSGVPSDKILEEVLIYFNNQEEWASACYDGLAEANHHRIGLALAGKIAQMRGIHS